MIKQILLQQSRYISQAPIILLVLFNVICFQFNLNAKEVLSFGDNSQVQILSDKAYRKSSDNSYEAQGNVIIKLGTNSIYGEKASLSFTTGKSQIWGNVRYIGDQYTLYATALNYDLFKNEFSVDNGKLVDDHFVILGKTIARKKDGNFYATEAEFTTCRDCPESWSILGSEVKVIPNQYVYLKHTFIKIKGVVVMYFPYIILPIKQDRESGLLFPKFGFDLERGFFFKQPYFHVLSKSSDFTIAPTNFGQRAFGGEFEFRKVFSSESDFNFFTIQSYDRIWQAGKVDDDLTSKRNLRQYYQTNLFLNPNHHFNFFIDSKHMSDLDFQSDYDLYYSDKLDGNEFGHHVGSSVSFSLFNMDVRSNFKNSSYFENSKGFDHGYVQGLGSLSLGQSPIALIENLAFINRVNFSQNINIDYMKPNHSGKNDYIDNILRFDYSPTLSAHYSLFNSILLNSQVSFDLQAYRLSNEYDDRSAKKYGQFYKNSASLSIEKNYARAYIETIKVPVVVEKSENNNLITNIPELNIDSQEKKIFHSSYKHIMTYEIAHSYYRKQNMSGNESLFKQFNDEDKELRFDERDIVRGSDNNLYDSSTRTDLPESNTLEFSLFNSILKKTPKSNYNPFENYRYNLNNFDISKIFYVDVSQGFLLGADYEEFDQRLTRLATKLGINLNSINLSATEYYFHQSNENITTIDLTQNFSFFRYTLNYLYDSFSTQRRLLKTKFELDFSDMVELRSGYYYNLETKDIYESYIGGIYRPNNNCWQFDIEYRLKDRVEENQIINDKIISFNFLLNYNSKSFNSFLGLTL